MMPTAYQLSKGLARAAPHAAPCTVYFNAGGSRLRALQRDQAGYVRWSLRMQLIVLSISMLAMTGLAAWFAVQSMSDSRVSLEASAAVNAQISALRDTQQLLGDYRFRLVDLSAQQAAEQAASTRPQRADGGQVSEAELRRWRHEAQERVEIGSQRLAEQIEVVSTFAPAAVDTIRTELPRLQALERGAVSALVEGDLRLAFVRISESSALLDRVDDELSGVAQRLTREFKAVAAQSEMRISRSFRQLIGVVIFASLLSVLLTGVILHRNIPALRKTVAAVKAFGRNNYDAELPPVGTHELGEIALGLRQFRDAAKRLAFLAETDSLTGLGNRFRLDQEIDSVMAQLRSGEHSAALLFIDLDRFKSINDAMGHVAGDRYLQEVGRRLLRAVPQGRLVARTSGNQFGVLLFEGGGIDQMRTSATAAVHLIREALDQPYRLEDQPVTMSGCVGIALAPYHGWTSDELMRNAEAAMYAAKSRGAANYRFYSRDLTDHIRDNLRIASDLRAAMRNGDLQVHFQPIVHADTGRPASAEALLRWTHRTLGVMSPARFVPVAEETQTIVELGEWVIQAVCEQLRAWQDAAVPVLPVAINIGARHFADETLIDNLRRCLAETGIDPSLIELEITESAVVQDPLRSVKIMSKLRAMGIRLSLDDFGTGYSSLAHLQRFPINKLKIDQSFVSRILTDSDSDTIVSATIGLGHDLGLTIVAEGAETADTVKRLGHHHCDLIQGYFISRAMAPDAFSEWLLAETYDKVASMRSTVARTSEAWPISQSANAHTKSAIGD